MKSKPDDSYFGTEDKRGYWKPKALIRYPNVFVWPPQIVKLLKWVPHYLYPWAIEYGLLAFLVWTYLTPSLEQMHSFSLDWILFIFGRNAALAVLVIGGQHF